MISDEMIQWAKEMVERNSQIIGIFWKLSPDDRLLFADRVEKTVKKTHELINKSLENGTNQLPAMATGK